ncbi:hypothetical protein P7C71_g4979, partial [Lecanoromycetidae sp. Uapishka_2]
MATKTPWILAADNDPQLLPLLRADPSIASSQDAHGYSLPHAAASYSHLDLLRTLVNEFHVDVNIKDEDGETPLFVVETVEFAQVLVEELKADLTIKNDEGLTAEEKIRTEGDFTTIADYLRECRERTISTSAEISSFAPSANGHPPPLPPNITMQLGTLEDEQALGDVSEVDPEFKQRIEELAARDDFRGEEGQRQLRQLITDAIAGSGRGESERDVRQRLG